MKFNKNVLIAIFLLSVFAVGTLSFVDTVEAAKWKKYDSETITLKDPEPGYKKKASYVTYIKGSKEIKINAYGYKIKNNKKEYAFTIYMSKTGNKLKWYTIDNKKKKSKVQYYTVKSNIKEFYKIYKKQLINDLT